MEEEHLELDEMTEDELRDEVRRQHKVIETWNEECGKLDRENVRLNRMYEEAVTLAEGYQRNRDMWKARCAHQAEKLAKLHMDSAA